MTETPKAAPDTLREKPVICIGMPTIERLNRGEIVDLKEVTLLHADGMVRALERRVDEAVAGAFLAAAERVRTVAVVHGDHYAAYYAPSNDAGELSVAILASMPDAARRAFEEAVAKRTELLTHTYELMQANCDTTAEERDMAREKRAALLAELKAKVAEWNKFSGLDGCLTCADELAAIIENYETKEKP